MSISIILAIVVVVVAVSIVGGLFLIYRFLIKKRFVEAILLFILVFSPILGSVYFIQIFSEYVSFSVTDKDVRHLFTKITGESFPYSAIIIEKEGSHGFLDRYISAIIRMDTTDYNKIHAIFSADSIYDVLSPDMIFRKDTITGTIWTTHVDRLKLFKKAQISNIGYEKYKSGYEEIGFGSDRQHIIIKRED